MDLIPLAAAAALTAVSTGCALLLLEVCTGPSERPVRIWTPPANRQAHPCWAELDRQALRAAALLAHRELEEARHELYPVGLA